MGIATLRRHREAADAAASGSSPPRTREELLEESLRVEREKTAQLQTQLAEIGHGKALSPELRAEIKADFDRLRSEAEARFAELEADANKRLEEAKAESDALRAELEAERAKTAAPPTEAAPMPDATSAAEAQPTEQPAPEAKQRSSSRKDR